LVCIFLQSSSVSLTHGTGFLVVVSKLMFFMSHSYAIPPSLVYSFVESQFGPPAPFDFTPPMYHGF
jgi:hypothetical protein